MRLYLDTCCLHRPFDDQSIDRNRMEAEAVLTILRRVHRHDWEMVTSNVLELEIAAGRDETKREFVQGFLAFSSLYFTAGNQEQTRMAQLVQLGFPTLDALHLACAETTNCDVLLTTDDVLLARSRRNHEQIRVQVKNPLAWLQEQVSHDR